MKTKVDVKGFYRSVVMVMMVLLVGLMISFGLKLYDYFEEKSLYTNIEDLDHSVRLVDVVTIRELNGDLGWYILTTDLENY